MWQALHAPDPEERKRLIGEGMGRPTASFVDTSYTCTTTGVGMVREKRRKSWSRRGLRRAALAVDALASLAVDAVSSTVSANTTLRQFRQFRSLHCSVVRRDLQNQ